MFQTSDPKESKRMSKKVKVRDDWDTVKEGIIEGLVRQKFQDPSLREMLMSTGTEGLEEGNRWGDEFWGVSFRTGKGDNRLGKILMKIREEGR